MTFGYLIDKGLAGSHQFFPDVEQQHFILKVFLSPGIPGKMIDSRVVMISMMLWREGRFGPLRLLIPSLARKVFIMSFVISLNSIQHGPPRFRLIPFVRPDPDTLDRSRGIGEVYMRRFYENNNRVRFIKSQASAMMSPWAVDSDSPQDILSQKMTLSDPVEKRWFSQ